MAFRLTTQQPIGGGGAWPRIFFLHAEPSGDMRVLCGFVCVCEWQVGCGAFWGTLDASANGWVCFWARARTMEDHSVSRVLINGSTVGGVCVASEIGCGFAFSREGLRGWHDG